MKTASKGFTLLELLIGAVISAILLAALSGVFYGMLRAQTRAYANLEEIVPRGQWIALLKNDFENMVLPTGVLCGAVLGLTLGSGTQRTDDLSFCASTGKIGIINPWGDVQRIEYSFLPSTGQATSAQGQLVRTVTRNLLAINLTVPDETVDPYDQIETTILFDGIASLQFQYFDGSTWYDYWDSTAVSNALPKAIHMRVDFPAESQKGLATAPIEIYCEVGTQSAAAAVAPVT